MTAEHARAWLAANGYGTDAGAPNRGAGAPAANAGAAGPVGPAAAAAGPVHVSDRPSGEHTDLAAHAFTLEEVFEPAGRAAAWVASVQHRNPSAKTALAGLDSAVQGLTPATETDRVRAHLQARPDRLDAVAAALGQDHATVRRALGHAGAAPPGEPGDAARAWLAKQGRP